MTNTTGAHTTGTAGREWTDRDDQRLRRLISGYLQCAAWAECPDIREVRNAGITPTPAARAAAETDCRTFYLQAANLIEAADDSPEGIRGSCRYTVWELAGHDLWLTRNRHGAGFWDGDYPEPWGSQLTAIARALGEAELYLLADPSAEDVDGDGDADTNPDTDPDTNPDTGRDETGAYLYEILGRESAANVDGAPDTDGQ